MLVLSFTLLIELFVLVFLAAFLDSNKSDKTQKPSLLS